MVGFLEFWLNRLLERLWAKPILACAASLVAVHSAGWIGRSPLGGLLPSVEAGALAAMLRTLSGSMLVVATFAVGSMVTALASAGRDGTPRTFALIVSDDNSQNALSVFIGAFIYGVVALLYFEDGFFAPEGESALLLMSVAVLALVVLTFVRWVDGIARLGRLGAVVERAERAATRTFERRMRIAARVREPGEETDGVPLLARDIGYVQRVDLEALQARCDEGGVRVSVLAMPGKFVGPGVLLARVRSDDDAGGERIDLDAFASAFRVGRSRTFDEDPCFGLIVLSEIGSRALSPAVNDPGTAIDIVRSFVRIIARLAMPAHTPGAESLDRVDVTPLTAESIFDDAFGSIARDGAGLVEVGLALQSAFGSLGSLPDAEIRAAAVAQSRLALRRAELAMELPEDFERLRAAAAGLASDAAD